MSFLATLKFLTAIPIRGKEELESSLGYFPLVGLILGLILAGLCWLFNFLPVALGDALVIVALIVLTGALHLDGFLDTCDGLAHHGTIEERWEVMSDSRAGGIGVVGVFSLLLLKFISLTALPQSVKIIALILMPVMGRWGMSYAIFAYPYAKSHGLGKSFKERSSTRGFAAATGITLIIALVLTYMWGTTTMLGTWAFSVGIIIMLGTWVIVVGMASFLKKRFGGLTGDNYGAICEVTETCTLIMFSIIM